MKTIKVETTDIGGINAITKLEQILGIKIIDIIKKRKLGRL